MTDNEIVANGDGVLGIELGSTRIKAILIAPDGHVLAQGAFQWENRFENGYWTYGLDEAEAGLRLAYAELAADIVARYGSPLRRLAAALRSDFTAPPTEPRRAKRRFLCAFHHSSSTTLASSGGFSMYFTSRSISASGQ